jgi:hypothetical protein
MDNDIDTFIQQCEKLQNEIQNPKRLFKHRKGFGKHAAVELLHAIGRYAFENNLDLSDAAQGRGEIARGAAKPVASSSALRRG